MITRQHAALNFHAILSADLSDDIADPQPNVAPKHLQTILRRPHDFLLEHAMPCQATDNNDRKRSACRTSVRVHRYTITLGQSHMNSTYQLRLQSLGQAR